MKRIFLTGLVLFTILVLFVVSAMTSLASPRVSVVSQHQFGWIQSTDEPTEDVTEVPTDDVATPEDAPTENVIGDIDWGNIINAMLTQTPESVDDKATPTPKKTAKPRMTPTVEDTPEEPTAEPPKGNQVEVTSDNTVQNPATIATTIGGKQKKDFSQYGCGVGYFSSVDVAKPDAVFTLTEDANQLLIAVAVPKGYTAVLVVTDPTEKNGMCNQSKAYTTSGKTMYIAMTLFQGVSKGDYKVWVGFTKSGQTANVAIQAAMS